MNNLLTGIATMMICAVGYFYSWRYQSRTNYKAALLLLVFCGLLLRVYTASDLFLHEWDERYHALVAKNLMKHWLVPTLYDKPLLPADYTNWTISHVWLHKQPLPLWTMAMSMKLFGVNELALRLPSVVLTTLGIVLMHYIGSWLFDRRTGLLAAFLYSINGLIIELAAGRVATDHIDVFFLFFIELSVFLILLFARRGKVIYNVLAGISVGAAILCKWLPALIVLPVWLLLVKDQSHITRKQLALNFTLFISCCCIVALPWQWYIHYKFPLEAAWEASHRARHLTEPLDGQTGSIFYFVNAIRVNYGELIYLPVLWFFWRTASNLKDLSKLALVFWFAIPLVFFSFAKTKMQPYLLFTAPALFIMTASFWWMLYEHRKKQKQKWTYNLVLLAFVVLAARYAIERMKPFDQATRNPQWAKDLRKLNDRRLANAVMFNYSRPVEVMFYTDITAYEGLPSVQTIDSLLDRGYHVLVNDTNDLSTDVRYMYGIEIVGLQAER